MYIKLLPSLYNIIFKHFLSWQPTEEEVEGLGCEEGYEGGVGQDGVARPLLPLQDPLKGLQVALAGWHPRELWSLKKGVAV